jgi:RNA polymerase sigma-70 factor (ECF subfamily)
MSTKTTMTAAVQRLLGTRAPEARALAHDFEALYTEHFNFVWRNLRRLGVHSSLVEDAAQDTFVVVHRRLSDLRPDASPKAFLFGIALRVAHDYRRTARRKGTTSLDTELAESPGLGPDTAATRAEGRRMLDAFLEELDADKRAVFVMAELEEMTAPEISEALSVNLNTVYSRLRAGRERFVAFLAANAAEGARRG